MHWPAACLGTSTASRLESRARDAVLIIGADKFTRADLAAIGFYQWKAAQLATAAIAELGARSTRDLYESHSPQTLSVPGFGVTALCAVAAAFEIKRMGGDEPLVAWFREHPASPRRELSTFESYKLRSAEMQAARERESARPPPTSARSRRPRPRRHRSPFMRGDEPVKPAPAPGLARLRLMLLKYETAAAALRATIALVDEDAHARRAARTAPVLLEAAALDHERRAKRPSSKRARRGQSTREMYARRAKSARLLASLDTKTPRPVRDTRGLAVLMQHGYIRRVEDGYLRTDKPFSVNSRTAS